MAAKMVPYSTLQNLLLKGSSIFLCAAFLWACAEPELPADVEQAMANVPAPLDYNLHVKPILSDRCFACHGPDKNKQKGDLRLDLPVAYEKKGDNGRFALVPGSLAKSEVFHRITSNDPEYMMPSPESHLSLTAEEKAIIIKWIKEGAEYKPHWSLVAPKKAEIPKIKNKDWAKNPIDQFVLSKLESKGLRPNGEATKETLIRRVTLDLTGLPPTIEEINAFLADQSPDAYEKVVDRLLQSPHYGERMAVDWMDVARYADTHGYQDDGLRNAYPWRDWVISAFNENLSYDQFVTWQLAGDLLPNPSREQLVATSFLRNHPQSQEGGIVEEEYRVEYVADRVNTFGKAFLAISTECARCHDHKYDPISQKNYFELFAFFNNNNESGEIPYTGEASPSLILTTAEAEEQLRFIREKIQPIHQQADNLDLYRPQFEQWLARAAQQPDKFSSSSKGLLGHFTFDEEKPVNSIKSKLTASLGGGSEDKVSSLVPARFGKGIKLDGDMAVQFNEPLTFERNQPFSISVWVNMLEGDESGPLFSRTNGILDNWRGYSCYLNKDQSISIRLTHVRPANEIDVKTKQKLEPGKWHHLLLTYDGSSKAKGVQFYIDGKETDLEVVTDNLKQSMMFAKDGANWGVHNFKIGQDHESISNAVFDEFRAYSRKLSALEASQLAGQHNLIKDLLSTPPAQLSAEQKGLLFEYYLLTHDLKYAQVQQQLAEIRGKENTLLTNQEEVMIYSERKGHRPTFLLERGEYDAPAEQVFAATPSAILPMDEKLPKNRLGLAKWLLSEEQPLFARVAVNRFWQQFFGRGLVKTVEDFGNQGDLPTHPELLDWLAVSFREEGWNVKDLVKTIVMSSTYRQSSVPTAQNLAHDPDNLLLSRAASFRMSAEMVRDHALMASGLLVPKVGGKSVYPYQPDGVWEALAVRNAVKYEQGHGADLYRRSLYTVWKRSSPHPAMTNFDVPERYACTVRRQNTSTPLQAMVLMNDVQFVEAARLIGEKMMQQGGDSPQERITYAFRALTSRNPRSEELNILLNLYKEEYSAFSKNPGRARELLAVGEHPVNKALPAVDLATCTVIANTLISFDECIVRR